jgi:hypothetical protein
MVYSIESDSISVNTVSFTEIPETENQTYIFTFIIKPSLANNPYYINPSSNIIYVNDVSVPLFGLQNISLPENYTYLIQQITIIYDIFVGNNFLALTSVTGYQINFIYVYIYCYGFFEF